MDTPTQEEYKRVQYVKVEKEDEFFSQIAKKYRGRYYKNLKNGGGWSFPYEFKDKIDTERMEYLKPLSQPEIQPKTILASIGIQTECNKNFASVGTDPIKASVTNQKNKSTNTCGMLQKYQHYKYDLPKGFEKYYEFYNNLITACQEKQMFY
jgi:hypothetical protein